MAVTSTPQAAPTRLSSLRLRGFRNLAEVDMQPGEHFNVLYGDNGAGKSSLLEAVAYLVSLRSFRDAPKEELITKGADQADLYARIDAEHVPRDYRIALSRTRARRVALDGKRPRSLSSYFASVQRVLFHPADAELAAGSPEGRRVLLDRILEQVDPHFCQLSAEYTKALRSRNRLLKSTQPERRSITAYDGMLARHGAAIGRARAELVEQMAPWVEQNFAEITDQALPLDIRYAPRTEPSEEALLRAFSESYTKDLARGYSGVGPHGDDIHIRVRDNLAKHHASQGQHRAIVLALKVAELFVLARRTGRMPVLLLDDVSSELDRRRNRRFFELLSRLGGQVFLTTTHPEFIVLEQARTDWQVADGQVRRA